MSMKTKYSHVPLTVHSGERRVLPLIVGGLLLSRPVENDEFFGF